MPNLIIGSKGFIGSRLVYYAILHSNEEWIAVSRENYDMWKGHRFDKVIWAAGTARKDAGDLFELNTKAVVKAIRDFPCEKFIYISSQAVYPEGYGHELLDISKVTDLLSEYGLSKYYGEVATEIMCDNYLILRPNGFCGPGLKKNVVHSLAKDPPELYYSWDSKLQIIHVDTFAEITFMLASSYSNEIFNVTSSEVVYPVDVAKYMGVDLRKVNMPKDRVPPHVEAIMDTTKLEMTLWRNRMQLPTTEEAISKWNESFEVRMSELWESMGEPRG